MPSRYRVKQSRIDRLIVKVVRAQRLPGVGKVARVALWSLGIEIPKQVQIGSDLMLGHPTAGIVVHPRTIIGDGVRLWHGVTIARADAYAPEPPDAPRNRVIIEDDVVIAAGAVVLFKPGRDLIIGKGAIIGANAVVLSSVPEGQTWVGNPAGPVHSR